MLYCRCSEESQGTPPPHTWRIATTHLTPLPPLNVPCPTLPCSRRPSRVPCHFRWPFSSLTFLFTGRHRKPPRWAEGLSWGDARGRKQTSQHVQQISLQKHTQTHSSSGGVPASGTAVDNCCTPKDSGVSRRSQERPAAVDRAWRGQDDLGGPTV